MVRIGDKMFLVYDENGKAYEIFEKQNFKSAGSDVVRILPELYTIIDGEKCHVSNPSEDHETFEIIYALAKNSIIKCSIHRGNG